MKPTLFIFYMKAEDVAREEGIAPRQKKESEPV
jgi:hypothetical protein